LAGGGEIIAGAGSNTVLRDAPRLAAQYGGNAADWAKVSTESFKAVDGSVIAAHAYRNVVTGLVVEVKGSINVAGFADTDNLLGIPGGTNYGVSESDATAWTYREGWESNDRMLFALRDPQVSDVFGHEFAHGLGENRHFGAQSILGPDDKHTGSKITNEDFHNLFGSIVDRHQRGKQGGFLPSFPMKFPGQNPSTYTLRKR